MSIIAAGPAASLALQAAGSAALRTLSVRKSATETGLALKWAGAPPAAPAGLQALHASGNEVAIETLEVCHEGLELE